MMEPTYLFNVLGQQREWLSARQALITQNIANANTAGYRSVDLVPFSKFLDHSLIQMTGNDPAHLRTPTAQQQKVAGKDGGAWETAHSGNNVTLEQEIARSGEIRGAFSLDTAMLKVFHNMWLSSVKG